MAGTRTQATEFDDTLDTRKILSTWQDLGMDQKLHTRGRHLTGFKIGHLGRIIFSLLKQHRQNSSPKRTRV